MVDGILYCNDGDWVESLTALVEDYDGRLRIIEWKEIRPIEAVAVMEAGA
jgi:UDP-2,3-diacylglucosamine pyrophosphatase LpxH